MIDTTLYGFHKPEDTDSADLRIFVGQNMDLIETALSGLDNAMLTSVSWLEVGDKPLEFPPSDHQHDWADITGEPTFDNYQGWDLIIGATTDRIASLATLTLVGAGTTSIDYDEILNVITINSVVTDNFYLSGITGSANGLATFTRSGLTDLTWNTTHTHSYGNLTDIPTTFTPATHSHTWLQIVDPPTTYDPSPHTHSWLTEITDKPTEFPPATHTHSWLTDITDIPTTFTPATHSHAISEITNLTDALNAKLESVPIATNTTVGTVKSGNGIGVNVEGYMFARLGKGLEFDVETNISAKVATALQAGIVQVGNGLGMSGDYMFVKTGTGLLIDGTWSVALDTTYMDTNFVRNGTANTTTIWRGTQLEYDGIITKDPNTIYFVVG
jgi:hypothetical protein